MQAGVLGLGGVEAGVGRSSIDEEIDAPGRDIVELEFAFCVAGDGEVGAGDGDFDAG